jgi:hypothetical protein
VHVRNNELNASSKKYQAHTLPSWSKIVSADGYGRRNTGIFAHFPPPGPCNKKGPFPAGPSPQMI